jgi:hypothetical protein
MNYEAGQRLIQPDHHDPNKIISLSLESHMFSFPNQDHHITELSIVGLVALIFI